MKTLQKIPAFLLAAVLCFGSFMTVAAQDVNNYQVYLGEAVSTDSQDAGVWQSAGALNEGGSSVYYAYESKNDNKFLRMANYDANVFSSHTTVNFALDYYAQWKSAVSIKFDYRLSEGDASYKKNEKIATISIGGVQKHLTYGDLTCNTQGSYDWKTYSVTLLVDQSDKADRLVITYYYDSAKKTAETSRYLDLDNVTVTSGTSTLGTHDLEFSSASSSDDLEFSFDYTTENALNKASLMLFGSDAANYSENTSYYKTQTTAFGGADVAAAIPQSGGCIYRGASSVKAGESDIYVLYDADSRNSFLRLGNFNGSVSSTQTRFSVKYYNNEANTVENMPVTNRIYYSFKYRLYASDSILVDINSSDNVLQFSTRSASSNNSGYVSFDELVINEPGDNTWHTYRGVMETEKDTTAYITIYCFLYERASLSPQIYLDMDDLTISPAGSSLNYAYLNGAFEGLVPTVSNGEDPFNSQVYNDGALGETGEKTKIVANDYAMKLKNNNSFSVKLGWVPKTDVYHVSFKTLCDSGKLRIYFGGRSGKCADLTIGEAFGQSGDALSVYWSKTENGYECDLYFARLVNTPIYSLDFVNMGNTDVIVDDVFVGEVKNISNINGDYQSFLTQLNALKSEYQANKSSYKTATVKALEKVFFNAEKITAYSSVDRMDSALTDISNLMSNAVKRSDLSELNSAIARAEGIYENGGADLYTNGTWISFEKALLNAKKVNDDNTQTKINSVTEELEAAIQNLTLKPVESSAAATAIALQIGGVGAGIGAAALITVFTIKRRKEKRSEK